MYIEISEMCLKIIKPLLKKYISRYILILNYCPALKEPNILQAKSKNKLVWCHFKQNQVHFGSSKQLAKANFLKKIAPAGEHLQTVRGNYITGRCAPGLRLLWHGSAFFAHKVQSCLVSIVSKLKTTLALFFMLNSVILFNNTLKQSTGIV